MALTNICPKCKGRLLAEVDRFGPFMSCLQCGFTLEGNPLTKFSIKPEQFSRRHPFPRRFPRTSLPLL